jgi:ketosteroid isomerase-like protein
MRKAGTPVPDGGRLKRFMSGKQLALPTLLAAFVYVIFGGAAFNLVENLVQERISGPTPWLVAAILLVLALAIYLQRRIESRIEELHRRQLLSVEYFAGGSGISGQAVYRAATALVDKASGPDCQIMAVNSFVEVFADSTDPAEESDRTSYLRAIESKLGQTNYHRILQLNARDRDALSRIRIGDVISKNYGEHYQRIVDSVRKPRPRAALRGSVVTRLDAVPARYPTSFVLIKTPDGSHLIWQMNEHVPHDPAANGYPIEEEKVRLAGVFIISDPDEQITQYFERWFNELASSEERTAITSEQLAKSPRAYKSNKEIVRDLFSVIDARQWSRLGEFFGAKTVYRRPGFATIDGLPALETFYRETRPVRTGTHQIWSIITEGDDVSCFGSLQGVAPNGDTINVEFADHYRFDNGRIVERTTYFYAPSILGICHGHIIMPLQTLSPARQPSSSQARNPCE